MKRFLLGIIIGFILFVIFLLSGGSEYLKMLGKGTEKAGERLEEVEDQAREGVERMKKTIGKTRKKISDYMSDE